MLTGQPLAALPFTHVEHRDGGIHRWFRSPGKGEYEYAICGEWAAIVETLPGYKVEPPPELKGAPELAGDYATDLANLRIPSSLVKVGVVMNHPEHGWLSLYGVPIPESEADTMPSLDQGHAASLRELVRAAEGVLAADDSWVMLLNGGKPMTPRLQMHRLRAAVAALNGWPDSFDGEPRACGFEWSTDQTGAALHECAIEGPHDEHACALCMERAAR